MISKDKRQKWFIEQLHEAFERNTKYKTQQDLINEMINIHSEWLENDDDYKSDMKNYSEQEYSIPKSKITYYKDEDIFSDYPDTPATIASWIQSLYSDRIIFTDRGKKSLQECVTKPTLLWDCLSNMATHLYPLFKNGSNNISKQYKEITGWEYARGEGKQTHSNKDLMSTRIDVYKGKVISIEPHIKRGRNHSSPDSIRVYFTYDDEYEILIIGHCGTHLPNYTSQKV